MNQSANLENLAKALLKVQGELPSVKATSSNPMFKGKLYADLNDFVEVSKPILTKNGLVIIQTVTSPSENLSEGHPICGLSTMLLHESGEYVSDTLLLPVIKPEDNKAINLAQQLGINNTYIRRYAWTSILGMISEEDNNTEIPSTTSGIQEDDVVTRRIETINEIKMKNPDKENAYRKIFDEYGGIDTVKDPKKLAEIITKMRGIK